MAIPTPPAPTRAPETKVTWASVAAGLLTVLVIVCNNTGLIPGYEDSPVWVKTLVAVGVIAGGALGAGYKAPHTTRPDLAFARGGPVPGPSNMVLRPGGRPPVFPPSQPPPPPADTTGPSNG